MESIKRVLIICPFARPNIGGVESHIDKLQAHCRRKDIFSTLLTYQPLTTKAKGLSYEVGDHYEIFRVPWFGNGLFNKLENYFPLSFSYLFPGLFVKSLTYYLRNHKKVDVIHAHGLVSAAITVILTSLVKKRSVVSTHAIYSFENRKILAFVILKILSRFDQILAVSDVSKQELIRLGLPESKVKIHPNWVDTEGVELLDKAASRVELGLPDVFSVVFIGRLIEKKGVKTLLNVAKEFHNINFYFAGSGPLADEVGELSKTHSNVRYFGVFSPGSNSEDRRRLLLLHSSGDLFVSPYTYDEGFSTTLIDSLMCGVPVAVTDRGSPPGFISKSVGFFLDAKDPEYGLKTLLKSISQGSIELPTSEVCKAFALKHFGIQNADVIIEAYGL